jgi:hypothetical protein
MVSIQTIKSLDFASLDEYFEYIVDSHTNGQLQQARELYNNLSDKQKKGFEDWFLTFYHYDILDNDSNPHKELYNLINILTL